MTIAKKMAAVLVELRAMPKSREASLAITKLEECAFWAALAVEGIVSPIDRLVGGPVEVSLKKRSSS